MTDRILDMSDTPARLAVRTGRLMVDTGSGEPHAIAFCDLSVVVASHPDITYTQAVLSRLAEHGGVFIACNDKRMPVGMMLPLEAHFIQSERFARQAAAPLPLRKRLWRQVAMAKIAAQSRLLTERHGRDFGLLAIAKTVRSGDAGNAEARAARRYWRVLFGTPFTRAREGGPPNNLLNYGYAVLRGIVARGICAAGLHPSLGLHHHNRYNAFCLADDLMEPLRPAVDRAVLARLAESGGDAELGPAAKRRLIGALTGRVALDGQRRTLFDAAHLTAASLAAAYCGEGRSLLLPEA